MFNEGNRQTQSEIRLVSVNKIWGLTNMKYFLTMKIECKLSSPMDWIMSSVLNSKNAYQVQWKRVQQSKCCYYNSQDEQAYNNPHLKNSDKWTCQSAS